MAKVTILTWQEIPSAVEAKDENGTQKVQLSQRFLELIDMIAMRRNLVGSDDYVMQWGKKKMDNRDGTASEVAEAVAAELEARYETIKEEAIKAS